MLDPAGKVQPLRELAYSELKIDIEATGSAGTDTHLDLFYAGPDTIKEAKDAAGFKFGTLIALRRLLEERIESFGLQKVYYDIELPLCKVLSEMEWNGINVDADALKEFGKELKVQIDALVKDIYILAVKCFVHAADSAELTAHGTCVVVLR